MLIAGVDAGASKTLLLLCHSEKGVLGRAKGPGLALAGEPRPGQGDALQELFGRLLAEAGTEPAALAHTALGVHGVDFEDELPAQRQALARLLGLEQASVTVVNDGIVALWGAAPVERCALLQHGTGITAACRSTWGQERLFDHLDMGGIFDLRREALKAARRMLDGRLAPSPLLGMIEDCLGVKGRRALSDAWYRRDLPREGQARLHSVVFEAWALGDANAASLVQRAASDYACSALAMARASGAGEIYFGGGVLSHAPQAFWSLLTKEVQRELPGAQVAAPRLGPDFGACLLAGFKAGLDVRALWNSLEEAGA